LRTSNQEVSRVFRFVLYTLAQLFAPFAPFFAELVHHNLVDDKTSIHLTDWPLANQEWQDANLESEMEIVRRAVELGHAVRKEQQIRVRQPLSEAKIKIPPDQMPRSVDLYQELMQKELNVKKISWLKAVDSETLFVSLDLQLTDDLKAEGEAREIIRTIQNMRRKAGLKLDQKVKVELSSWPQIWQKEIEKKTLTHLVEGEETRLIV